MTEALTRSTRAKVVPAELLCEFLVAVDHPHASFTFVSDRNPRRRLLIGSGGIPQYELQTISYGPIGLPTMC